jgi:hypothetical protein
LAACVSADTRQHGWSCATSIPCRPVPPVGLPPRHRVGKRLFSEGTIPLGLKLVDSKVSTTGVVIGTYEPAGEIVTGSFALD